MKKPTLTILLFITIFLLSMGISYAASGLQGAEAFYGEVTVDSISAIAGSTICVGSSCIGVDVAGDYGGADPDSKKLQVSCAEGSSIIFSITGTGCTGVGTLSQTCSPGRTTNKNLSFGGSCGAAAAAGGSGGGGGGGGSGGVAGPSVGAETSLAEDSSYSEGKAVAVTLTQGDKVTVEVDGKEYDVILTTLTEDYVVLEYEGQFVTVTPGQSAKIDVDGDGKADVEVTLKGIEGGEAELTFRKLQDVSKDAAKEEEAKKEKEAKEAKEAGEKAPLKGVVVVIAIVVLGLIGYFVYLKRPKV